MVIGVTEKPPPELDGLLLRVADSVPSRLGSSAEPAATRVERASAMRAAALATVGLASCAAAMSSTSSGSSSWRHHSASAGREPVWVAGAAAAVLAGSGAFHCAGMGAVAMAGGRATLQAPSAVSAKGTPSAPRSRNGLMVLVACLGWCCGHAPALVMRTTMACASAGCFA